MPFHFVHIVKPRLEQSIRLAALVGASLGLAIAAGNVAGAAGARSERPEARAAGEPIMAIVSLRRQQITIYDAEGGILRAPVSTGQSGRETPAGIFSVIQKEAEHYSNCTTTPTCPYAAPHLVGDRPSWWSCAGTSGVARLHPAAYEFAERLFEVTRLGMRVIVAPSDVAPVTIVHPALFQPKLDAAAVAAGRAAEADEAARKADQARLAARKAIREAAQARVPVRVAENSKLRAEAQLAAAESDATSAASIEAKEQAEAAKAKTAADIAEFTERLAAAKAELLAKLDAIGPLREAAVAAEAARVTAEEAQRKVARNLEPVSIFISRKTQRLYIRQAFQPVLEIPVTVQDPDRPIGTHVFTAVERTGGDIEIRWSVVSLVGGLSDGGVPNHATPPHGGRGGDAEPIDRP